MKQFFAIGLLMIAATAQAASHYQILTSTKRDTHAESWQLTSSDFPSYNGNVRWSINKRTLHGGKQEGVDLVEVDNGRLQFRVIPTRGMSVLDVTLGDVRLGWRDGFNEWMVRCGLSCAGHPG